MNMYGRVEKCLEEQAIGEYVWESGELLGGASYVRIYTYVCTYI